MPMTYTVSSYVLISRMKKLFTLSGPIILTLQIHKFNIQVPQIIFLKLERQYMPVHFKNRFSSFFQ